MIPILLRYTVHESGPFGSETGGPNATSNKGLYGVDLILRTRVKNSDPSFPRPIQHFFAPRCSGSNVNDPRGKFWGAGAVDSGFPYTGSTCGVPRMRFKGITTTCDATNFPPNSTDIGNIEFPYITVNANTTDQPLRYYLVIGGASDLPASWRRHGSRSRRRRSRSAKARTEPASSLPIIAGLLRSQHRRTSCGSRRS